MTLSNAWHPITTPPDSQRRVLVAQDDGYIEMADYQFGEFIQDWPSTWYGNPRPKVSRAAYWCDLPSPPTKENT